MRCGAGKLALNAVGREVSLTEPKEDRNSRFTRTVGEVPECGLTVCRTCPARGGLLAGAANRMVKAR